MEKSIEELKNSLQNNMPTLFLGAGFSREAICRRGIMPTGSELKEELFQRFLVDNISDNDKEQIQKYNLREICDYIDAIIENGKAEREIFLTERLKGVRPNEKGYHKLFKYKSRQFVE